MRAGSDQPNLSNMGVPIHCMYLRAVWGDLKITEPFGPHYRRLRLKWSMWGPALALVSCSPHNAGEYQDQEPITSESEALKFAVRSDQMEKACQRLGSSDWGLSAVAAGLCPAFESRWCGGLEFEGSYSDERWGWIINHPADSLLSILSYASLFY